METDPPHENGSVVKNASHPNTVGQGRSGPRGRARWFNFRRRVPSPLRGDPSGQLLMRTFGVVDLIEPVDLFLQLLEGLGQGLLVEEAEEGLVKAFVLALRGRFRGFPGSPARALERAAPRPSSHPPRDPRRRRPA